MAVDFYTPSQIHAAKFWISILLEKMANVQYMQNKAVYMLQNFSVLLLDTVLPQGSTRRNLKNTNSNIHPLLMQLILQGHRVCWSRSQLTLGKRPGVPWTSHQSIAGPIHRDRQPINTAPGEHLDSSSSRSGHRTYEVTVLTTAPNIAKFTYCICFSR